MRVRFASFTALSLCVFAMQSRAAGVDCVALELSDPDQVATVVARIARTDEAAMQRLMKGAACLDDDARIAAGRAAGEFFDQKPREYLKLAAAGSTDDISWLEALTFAPDQIHPDPLARIRVLARRVDTLQANADLIEPANFEFTWREFASRIDRLATDIGKQFPRPLVMTDPLTGIEFDPGTVLIEPGPPAWIPMTKYAQGTDWWVFASVVRPGGRLYLLISGFSFKYSPDGSAIEEVIADEGWVELVDIRDNHAEVLAPASELFTTHRIPREVAVALCQNAVERLSQVMKDGRLQKALDDRIHREPDAGLMKPLRDAFIKARFDVKRYREIPVPDSKH